MLANTLVAWTCPGPAAPMRPLWFVLIALLALLALARGAPTRTYANCRVIFTSPLYRFYWEVNGASVSIAMDVAANRWVGFGVGASYSMVNMDAQIGWLADDGTTEVLRDAWATGNGAITADAQSDNTNVAVQYVGGVLTVEFERPLNTGESTQDNVLLSTGPQRLLFAYSSSTSLGAPGATAFPPGAHLGYESIANFDMSVASSCPAPPPSASPPPTPGPPPLPDYDSCLSLDAHTAFYFCWRTLTAGASRLEAMFEAVFLSDGYVAMGVASGPGAGMNDGDYFLAYFDSAGLPVLRDMNGDGTYAPSDDAVYSLTLRQMTRENGTLRVYFARDLDTGDADDNVMAGAGPTPMLWAHASNSNPTNLQYHNARGQFNVDLSIQVNQRPRPPPPLASAPPTSPSPKSDARTRIIIGATVGGAGAIALVSLVAYVAWRRALATRKLTKPARGMPSPDASAASADTSAAEEDSLRSSLATPSRESSRSSLHALSS